jgi:hypothetical protein
VIEALSEVEKMEGLKFRPSKKIALGNDFTQSQVEPGPFRESAAAVKCDVPERK